MLRCVVAVGEGRKVNSGTPTNGGSSLQKCSQPFAASPGCCSLPTCCSENLALKKMTQIWVISDCDYLRANYCLLHHHVAFSCLPLSLLLLTISLSLALPPETTAGTAEESMLTSAPLSWGRVVYQLRVQVPGQKGLKFRGPLSLPDIICRDNWKSCGQILHPSC